MDLTTTVQYPSLLRHVPSLLAADIMHLWLDPGNSVFTVGPLQYVRVGRMSLKHRKREQSGTIAASSPPVDKIVSIVKLVVG